VVPSCHCQAFGVESTIALVWTKRRLSFPQKVAGSLHSCAFQEEGGQDFDSTAERFSIQQETMRISSLTGGSE
jgi:hypothetical protein